MAKFVFALCLLLGFLGRAHGQGLAVTTPEPGLTSGQCVRAANTTNITPLGCAGRTMYVSVTGTIELANTDCGAVLVDGGGSTAHKVTLPASPFANCTFTFNPVLNGFSVDFNGKTATLPGTEGALTVTTINIPPAFRTIGESISLQYNADHWEQSAVSSPIFQSALQPTNAPQLANGQVYFSWNSSTSQFQLCPINGPGGLVVDGAMRQVPLDCLTLAQSATTTSATNYFYAVRTDGDTLHVSDAEGDPDGKILLTFSDTVLGNINDRVAITCHSIVGAIQANVRDTGKIISNSPGSSKIELQNVHTIDPYTSGGICIIVRLASSTTGHFTGDNGIEQMTGGTGHYTLVGICKIGASNSVSDSATKRNCASWYNRKAKTCINQFTTDRTTTSTSFVELNQEIRCEFVTWGTGDPHVESDLAWSISGMMKNNTGADGVAVTAGFDGTTAETEQTGFMNAGGALTPPINTFPLSVKGSRTGLTEGWHYITLLAKALSGGTATISGSGPQNPVTSLEVRIPQ